MKIKGVIIIIVNVLLISMVLVFLLISPYKYEWDETLRQIDDDKLLVLRAFWLFSSLSAVMLPILHRPKSKFFYIFYALILGLSVYKLIFLFTIK